MKKFMLIGFVFGVIVGSGGVLAAVSLQPRVPAPSMSSMHTQLRGLRGEAYDKAFLELMIAHHEDAVAMGRASADQANHQELKQLSQVIVEAQEKEIQMMKQWQKDWGYVQANLDTHKGH